MAKGSSILVTGGAGYLGSILVPELAGGRPPRDRARQFHVSAEQPSANCANPNFDVVNGDTRSVDTLKPLVAKADYVFPLAALVGAPLCKKDPIAATTTNRDAIATLCKMMSPQQRIVMPITNSGYGVGEKGKFCTEDSPLRPVSLYGRDKVEAEKIILERDNSISLRLATVFGMAPRMRIDLLVNDFVYRAVNDRFVVLFEAHFKRNYIHIRDVARAFMHAMDNFDDMKGGALQCRPVRRQHFEGRAVRADQGANSELPVSRGAGRRGPRQARLHRFQCEDRGHRLRAEIQPR